MKITLVTSCTNRKRFTLDPELQLRKVKDEGLEDRFQSWKQRLHNSDATDYPVREVYSGEHWYVTRQIEGKALGAGIDLQLSICSAGYGLIAPTDRIKPYSVTFAGGSEDSISRGRERTLENQKWWELQNSWQRNGTDQPRSISQLINDDPDRILLVALSNVYLRSIYHDLLEARKLINDPNNMIIVSAGSPTLWALTENLVNLDARFEWKFNCARMSINIRTAEYLIANLDKVPMDLLSTKKHIFQLAQELAPHKTYHRDQKTDEQIKVLITSMMEENLGTKPSPLLRILRDRGIACEQKRFSRLFKEVNDE